jgi:hypothetical protein
MRYLIFFILVVVDLNLLFLFVFLSKWEYKLVGRKDNHFTISVSVFLRKNWMELNDLG